MGVATKGEKEQCDLLIVHDSDDLNVIVEEEKVYGGDDVGVGSGVGIAKDGKQNFLTKNYLNILIKLLSFYKIILKEKFFVHHRRCRTHASPTVVGLRVELGYGV